MVTVELVPRKEEVSIPLNAKTGGCCCCFSLSFPHCLLAWDRVLLQREPLSLSLASSSVTWVLGAAAMSLVSHQQFQAPRDSVYLGSSLPMLESPVHVVDWVMRAVADGD